MRKGQQSSGILKRRCGFPLKFVHGKFPWHLIETECLVVSIWQVTKSIYQSSHVGGFVYGAFCQNNIITTWLFSMHLLHFNFYPCMLTLFCFLLKSMKSLSYDPGRKGSSFSSLNALVIFFIAALSNILDTCPIILLWLITISTPPTQE